MSAPLSTVAVLFALAVPAPAHAQGLDRRFEASLAPVVYLVEQFTSHGIVNPNERPLFGGRFAGRYRALGFEATALFRGWGDEFGDDTPLRLTELGVWIHPVSWLGVGGEAAAWRGWHQRGGELAEEVWTRFGAGVRLIATLGVPGLAGTLTGAVYPGGSVTTNRTLELDFSGGIAHRVEVTLRYAVSTFPLLALLGYRLDWFAIESDFNVNTELTRGVVIAVGIHLGN